MGDNSYSTCSSRTSVSYEDTWNSNETFSISSDVWDDIPVSSDNLLSSTDDMPASSDYLSLSEVRSIPVSAANPLSPPRSSHNETFVRDPNLSVEIPITNVDSSNENSAIPAKKSQEASVTDMPSQGVYDLPPGKYALVGFNLHMTGNRLIDEICQISAYTEEDDFNIFVMPHGNPTNFMREHYGLNITTLGNLRVMREMASRRPLRTRAELSALNDFLSWLEKINDNHIGIVLIFNDIRKIVSLKMIQTIKRLNLFEKFRNVVKGFCNIYTLATDRKTGETKYFSLKALSKVFMPHVTIARRGPSKARACYEVLYEILADGNHCSVYNKVNRKITSKFIDAALIREVCENIIEHFENHEDIQRKPSDVTSLIYKYSMTVTSEDMLLINFQDLLERQNSFRTVFKGLMNFDLATRQIVNRVRRKIVNHNLEYKDVEIAWEKGRKNGLKDLFSGVKNIIDKEFEFVTEVFERHFDDEQETYIEMLVNKRKEKQKKTAEYVKVKTDLVKSFKKLPKISEEDRDSSKGRRRVNSF